MIQVIFKDLETSELAREAAIERIDAVVERFPDLADARLVVTLSMQNSPIQAGPDEFTVKVHCRGGRYHGLTLEKSAPNLYAALADVVEHMLERLNRFTDRVRIKGREKARKLARKKREPWTQDNDEENKEVLYEKNR
ncbi:MAG: HPF/RaiA family ribosome-associated protein [Calothrix sp. SM1_5_4]|nr:HPF/RaiA family ribosome-associated protein [Calothrix sp. SM1_5_4]